MATKRSRHTAGLKSLGGVLQRINRGVAFRSAVMKQGKAEPADHAQPLLDAVSLFEELTIAYALVGGIAAMCYSRARFTEDLDFVAASGHGDVLARNTDAMHKHHFDPSCTWKLYHESGVEVDLWKDEFADQIVLRSVAIELAGRKVKVAEVHDLIAMKPRAGRLQDDYDISEILKGTAVDDEVVRSRVTAEQFEHYLAVKLRVK